jgi:hypothetical protein
MREVSWFSVSASACGSADSEPAIDDFNLASEGGREITVSIYIRLKLKCAD